MCKNFNLGMGSERRVRDHVCKLTEMNLKAIFPNSLFGVHNDRFIHREMDKLM